MSDPARYRKSHIKRKVPYWLIFKRYWRRILTTGGLWFVYDFISYPSGVFSTTILDVVIPVGSPLIVTAGWNTLLYTFYLPGAIAGAFLADRIGRKKTMALGFVAQGVIGLIMGGTLNLLVQNSFPMFVIMYGLFLMMGELGPGDTIGLVSTEVILVVLVQQKKKYHAYSLIFFRYILLLFAAPPMAYLQVCTKRITGKTQ